MSLSFLPKVRCLNQFFKFIPIDSQKMCMHEVGIDGIVAINHYYFQVEIIYVKPFYHSLNSGKRVSWFQRMIKNTNNLSISIQKRVRHLPHNTVLPTPSKYNVCTIRFTPPHVKY